MLQTTVVFKSWLLINILVLDRREFYPPSEESYVTWWKDKSYRATGLPTMAVKCCYSPPNQHAQNGQSLHKFVASPAGKTINTVEPRYKEVGYNKPLLHV